MFGLFKKEVSIDESRIFQGMSIGELVEHREGTREDCLHLVDTEILTIIKESGMEGTLTIEMYVENPTVTSL